MDPRLRSISGHPSVVPVWVRLPHLPLHCWNPKSLEVIGNKLGKYIDRAERRDQYSCVRICVEVDLEEGLPEAIKLTVADWSYIQVLDYEQLPFKCRHFHNYGHFAKHCKKKAEEEAENSKGEQWTQIQKAAPAKQNTRTRGKGALPGSGAIPLAQIQGEGSSAPPRADPDNNPFEILSTPEEPSPVLAAEEPEQQPNSTIEDKNMDETAHLQAESPRGASNPPTYIEMTRKKTPEISGSSDDETFERPSKRDGRKTHREAREAEAERQKMQGNQSMIEMSIGRNTRARPPKGGPAPPPPPPLLVNNVFSLLELQRLGEPLKR
jgi:hypothetical protein